MAENPATWGNAEKIINQEIRKFYELPPGFCGLSLPSRIAHALRDAGLLAPEPPIELWRP